MPIPCRKTVADREKVPYNDDWNRQLLTGQMCPGTGVKNAAERMKHMQMRMEHDTMGEIAVPAERQDLFDEFLYLQYYWTHEFTFDGVT